ncbi:chorismate-binding protein [Nonlabens sp. YIK11]|uniref:chorismate-binding protein n=1 Tax=Nonlabens sp. YIK11 TaxID=1453349 RepID=UPI0006DCB16E|nr:chorismate-binding protein [Nonlabens sp. YIK11]
MRESLLTYTQELLHQNLPFLLLRKSGESNVEILHQNSQKLHETPHDTMSCAVLSKFLSSENQFYIIGEVRKSFSWEIKRRTLDGVAVNLPENVKKEHQSRVQSAVTSLKNGALKKVVLSLKHTVSSSTDSLKILTNLLDEYPKANCYFFHHPSIGTWLGATPETLVSYKDGLLKTMSLAGTKSALADPKIPWGIKEKNEQQLVTDFISNALEKVTGEKPVVGDVETIKAGSLLHLKTSLEVLVDYGKINEVVNELHPTPAVCGLPRQAALDYIRNHENYDRSFYTGYIGIQNPVERRADYYVNLRCLEIDKSNIYLYAGGGITELSIPQDEVQEIENKLMTMARIIT